MKHQKATLVIHQKLTSPKGLVREIAIWRVPKSERYPEGVRYRLVLVNPVTKAMVLLFDNHWPKGHHVHALDREERFEFATIPDLVRKFRDPSELEEARYHEDKKNQN